MSAAAAARAAEPLQALIWDVDGTLAETEDDGHRVAFNQAFEEAGLPWRWDRPQYAELLAVTGGKERMLAWWHQVDPQAAATPEAAARVAHLHTRKTVHYLALLDGGAIALRPGVAALLQQAQAAGLRQAIATTTTLDNVTRLLRVTLGPQAESLFEVIGAGDVVPNKKPAPDIYHWVLQRLGLPAANCLAVEDSVPGVQAACAAALPVLRVRGVFGGSESTPGPVADVSGFDGLTPDRLRQWHAAPAAPRAARQTCSS